MRKQSVLVVGAGMYVCGRGTAGIGTILPALVQSQKRSKIGEIYVLANSSEGVSVLKEKIAQINKTFSTDAKVHILSSGLENAIEQISEPCAAIIATPDDTHSAIALKLMENGFHLLVVKPLAPTLKEVQSLVEAQKKFKVYGMVEFHKRFDRANLKIKDAMDEKRFGDPLYFIVEYSQRKSIPTQIFKDWSKRTNIMQYLGIHYVDIIYFSTKAKPLRVMATGQRGYLQSKNLDMYDSILATIEWKLPNGKIFHSNIHTNWIDPENTTSMSDQRIKVICTNGRLESDQKYRGLVSVSDTERVEEVNPDFCQLYTGADGAKEICGYGIDSINTFINDVNMIFSKKKCWSDFEGLRPTFTDTVVPTQVIEAINKSLESNFSWINI